MSQMDQPADRVGSQPALSAAILAVGAVAYGIACVPAINARGYPPIDALWDAFTYLWPAPILLSAVFAEFDTASRKWQLVVYAICTAAFFEATTIFVVPRYVTIEGVLLGTLFFFGPVHLALTFAFEKGCRAFICRYRKSSRPTSDRRRLPQMSLAVFFFGWSILLLTIAFPFAYQSTVNSLERSRGSTRADSDWQSQAALVFVEDYHEPVVVNGISVDWYFDRDTGLELRPMHADRGFRDAYNQRISYLVAKNGTPKWSMVHHLIEPGDLIALLSSNELREILAFPYEVTDSIVAFRQGTINRWGSVSSSRGPGLTIATPGSSHGVSQRNNKVFVGEIKNMPEVVVIRDGYDWVGLFHRNGRLLMDASR